MPIVFGTIFANVVGLVSLSVFRSYMVLHLAFVLLCIFTFSDTA